MTSTTTASTGTTTDRTHRRRRTAVLGTAAAVALIAGGFAYVGQTGTPSTGAARVSVAELADVGQALVDGQGKALYMFEPDEAASVTCTGSCAAKWPPLVASGPLAELPTGPGVRPELLGSAEGEDGAQVVTYAGWPLYRYASDDPGQTEGHGEDENGGLWFAMTPAGERIP